MVAGAPPKTINWELVDKLIKHGSNGVQIAARLGIHPQTLYSHCQEEKKTNFSSYFQEKRAEGDSLLHETQFEKAIEGNVTMLIWLGKQRLKQSENDIFSQSPREQEITNENKSMMKDALLDKYREKFGKIEEDVIFNESEAEQELS